VEWRWLRDPATVASGPDPLALVPIVVPWGVITAGHTASLRLWATLRWGVRLEVEGAADLGRRSLIFGGGAISYRHRCGCLGAALRVIYRSGREWPDVMVAVDVGGLGTR
jgi:hypothetical protein